MRLSMVSIIFNTSFEMTKEGSIAVLLFYWGFHFAMLCAKITHVAVRFRKIKREVSQKPAIMPTGRKMVGWTAKSRGNDDIELAPGDLACVTGTVFRDLTLRGKGSIAA